MIMNEKTYKTMSRSGAGALTVGIIMMVAGFRWSAASFLQHSCSYYLRYYCSGKRGTFVT